MSVKNKNYIIKRDKWIIPAMFRTKIKFLWKTSINGPQYSNCVKLKKCSARKHKYASVSRIYKSTAEKGNNLIDQTLLLLMNSELQLVKTTGKYFKAAFK